VRAAITVRMAMSLICVGVIAAVVSGASYAKTDGAAAPQATTITFAHWSSSPVELAGIRATLAAFGRAYPSINVKEVNLDPYPEGMLARFAARKPPDVFYVDSSVFPDWVGQGVIEPLDSYFKKAGMSLKPFFPRLLSAFQYKGKTYGLPKDWSPLATEVDTTILAKAHVSPPTTWAQLTSAGQALKAAGQPGICLSIDLARILAFMYQNNGGFLNGARTQAIVNTPAIAVAVST
jgi:multiple sugar transport system substrate-binding protein